jgi:precorrin-6B methylase 2
MLPARFAEAVVDPPRVHPEAGEGVWRTEQACYDFIGTHAGPGSVTLETGLGLSTVAFAMLGCAHTAVFLDPAEGAILEAWAATHDLDVSRLELLPGGSDRVLPELRPGPLDLVFIDGCHGYPMPQLDFVYACRDLKRGGVLVVDDLELSAPYELAAYLDADGRWDALVRTGKWGAWCRRSEGSLVEEFTAQPLRWVHRSDRVEQWIRALPARIKGKAARVVRGR